MILLNVDSANSECLNFYINNDLYSDTNDVWKLRIFERVSATVVLKAAIDEASPFDTHNFSDIANTRPKIIWRNRNLFFHVTKSMDV